MNLLDLIIIGVLVIMFLGGYSKGFIKSLFDLLSMIITLALTYYLYPFVSKFIMNETGLYEKLSESISKTFDFEQILKEAISKESQFDAIKTLSLPDNLKEMLTSNNNPEVFKLLDVTSFTDYVSGSLASIVVNIVSFLVLFVIIYIVLSVLVNMLNLISKLPVLNKMNKLTGGLLGLVLGLGFIFLGLTLLSIFISTKSTTDILTMIDESSIGSFLYYNNPIMDLLNNNISNNHFWNILAG